MQKNNVDALDGNWWEPSLPDRVYKGTLFLNENNNGKLILKDTEENLTHLPQNRHPRLFYGNLTHNNNEKISLFNTFISKSPATTSPKKTGLKTSAEYITNTILFGEHIISENQNFINGAILDLTGLDEWCNGTSIHVESKITFTDKINTEHINVSFNPSSSCYYDLGNGCLIRINSEFDGPAPHNSKNVTLRERNTFELKFANSMSISQILEETHIWQCLLTLSLRLPSRIKHITLLSHQEGKTPSPLPLLVPRNNIKKQVRSRSSYDTLLNQTKIGDNMPHFLKEWRHIYDKIGMSIIIFTGSYYQKNTYMHTTLLTYLQALEVLHRDTCGSSRFPTQELKNETLQSLQNAIPESLPDELRDYIKNQINFVGAPTLADRLKDFFSRFPKSLEPIFHHGNDDMSRLKDARNYLTHFGKSKLDRDFLWSREIYIMTEKCRLFFEICLLGTLGLSDDKISELLQPFTPYSQIRGETMIEKLMEMEARQKV